MRLRSLTEAECYARCYGGRTDDRVSLITVAADRGPHAEVTGEQLRRLFDGRGDPSAPGQTLEAA